MIDLPEMYVNQQHTTATRRHRRWVKSTHWIITLSFLFLSFTGYVILMCHPRLYWGKVGNDLTPALFELPISRNYQHGGWEKSTAFYSGKPSPVSASRTYDIYNQNGWGRSLHFLSAWFLVVAGLIYLLTAIFSGHIKRNLLPKATELRRQKFWQDIKNHLRLSIPAAANTLEYGLLQKSTYLMVIVVLMPLAVVSGLTMSPAITAAYPFLLTLFGGVQSARTIHFFAAVALVLFLLVHVVMVIRSGFKQQIADMTFRK